MLYFPVTSSVGHKYEYWEIEYIFVQLKNFILIVKIYIQN